MFTGLLVITGTVFDETARRAVEQTYNSVLANSNISWAEAYSWNMVF